jgi:hypothetical protein
MELASTGWACKKFLQDPLARIARGLNLFGDFALAGKMKIAFALLGLFAAGQAAAQDFEVGRTGWQLERLSRDFVLLRANIVISARGNRKDRQGLLILTCERGQDIRRIRFQIGDVPKSPSTHATSYGRAIVRGATYDRKEYTSPIFPDVRFFDDGSFEFQEKAGFSNSVMRGMLGILQKLPAYLEVVLYKGPETLSFRLGTAMQFRLNGLDSNLGSIYGFEGLCFRSDL